MRREVTRIWFRPGLSLAGLTLALGVLLAGCGSDQQSAGGTTAAGTANKDLVD